VTAVIPTPAGQRKYAIIPMPATTDGAHAGGMHPIQNMRLAHAHIDDLHAEATRRALVRRARRGRGARSPAPPLAADATPLPFLAEPDERRPPV
jgi:hypothetical protein